MTRASTPMTLTIAVIPLSGDTIMVAGNAPCTFGTGATKAEALGDLLLRHGARLGIRIEEVPQDEKEPA